MDDPEFIEHLERHGEHYAHYARLVAQFLAWKVRQRFGSPQLPLLHKIEYRGKSIDSLKRNFEAGRYNPLPGSPKDIPDLAGARLLFFFQDDVERFVRESDFVAWFGGGTKIRWVHGSKMRDGSRAQIGYESHHLTICVSSDNDFYRALSEFDRITLKGLYCEVQFRTLLKHAWAEAEHDLRYKIENLSGEPFPREESTRLLNTAGSISLADEELANVKGSVSRRFNLFDRKPPEYRTEWRYSAADLSDAFEFRGVRYHYVMVDRGPLSPSVREQADIFNVDGEMLRVLAIEGYKQKMWDMMKREDPEFIAQIDHETLVARMACWDAASRTITVQPAYYSDQAVTNHVQVLKRNIVEINPPKQVRSLAFAADGSLLNFEQSPMSNTLGVGCVIRVEASRWVVPRRSKGVAFDSGKLGCSSSGALEWTELGHWRGRDFVSWFGGGMSRELEEELGLKIEPDRFRYLGLAREHGRVGKPQVFFFLDLDELSFRTVEARWTTYTNPPVGEPNSKTEYVELRAFDDEGVANLISDSSERVRSASGGVGISEELRMNLALAVEYLLS
jgi:ppGpp synthetase/RelA/SpoT-type nucleotidyltranferase